MNRPSSGVGCREPCRRRGEVVTSVLVVTKGGSTREVSECAGGCGQRVGACLLILQPPKVATPRRGHPQDAVTGSAALAKVAPPAVVMLRVTGALLETMLPPAS